MITADDNSISPQPDKPPYKRIEDAVVSGFNKVADSFVNTFMTREGESVEDAKARLTAEQKAREEAAKL